MTTHDLSTLCDEISTLTREMLDAAKRQEWETVSAMEFRRRTLFARAFSEHEQRTEGRPESAEQLGQLIRNVLDLDHELIQLGKAGRRDLADALGRLRDGHRVREAYGKTGM
jgi:hypothetical protein